MCVCHVHMCVYAHTCAHIPAHIHTYVCVRCFCLFYLWYKKHPLVQYCLGICVYCVHVDKCVYMHMPVHTFLHTYTHMCVFDVFACFICGKKKHPLVQYCVGVCDYCVHVDKCVYMHLPVHTFLHIWHTHTHTYILMLAMLNHGNCHFMDILGFRIFIFFKNTNL